MDHEERKWADDQIQIADLVLERDEPSFSLEAIRLVGGLDVSFDPNDSTRAVGALSVLSFPDLRLVHMQTTQQIDITIPYRPTFLSRREAPVATELISALPSQFKPDVLLCDGNGRLHPRRCGLACQVGVEHNLVTVGCAKTLFCMDGLRVDTVGRVPAPTTPLRGDSGTVWGNAVRIPAGKPHTTKDLRNPVFVSVGNRVSLQTATELTRLCCVFRVPEPIRLADQESRRLLRVSGSFTADEARADA